MRPISHQFKEIQTEKNKLWECQLAHSVALNRRYLYDTDESYKECAEALQKWDEQDKKVQTLVHNYFKSTGKTLTYD